MRTICSVIQRLWAPLGTALAVVVAAGVFVSCQSAEKSWTQGATDTQTSQAKAQAGEPVAVQNPEGGTNGQQSGNRTVVVYYFATTYRCHACRVLENYTKEAVETGFASLAGEGTVEFRQVDIQQPQNKHYIEQYQLYTKSVVVSQVTDGKETSWKNLDQVWTLLRDQNRFTAYVQNEVKALL